MSEETTSSTTPAVAPKAPLFATYKEIVQACTGCDPKANADDAQFVADCQEQEMTLIQSASHWMQTLNARVEARDEEVTKAQAEAEKKTSKSSKNGLSTLSDGNASAGGSSEATGDAIGDWNAIVKENMEACGGNKAKAVRKSVLGNPDAHQAYLGAYTAANQSPAQQMRRRK